MNTKKTLMSLLLLCQGFVFSSEKAFKEVLSKVPVPVVPLKDYRRVCCEPEDREKFKEQFEREYKEQFATAYASNFFTFMEEHSFKRSQGRDMPRRLIGTTSYGVYPTDIKDNETDNITTQEIADRLFGKGTWEQS
jgi:hypothetical protein